MVEHTPTPTLVVFGLDPEGNPRAGRIAEPDADVALKAAAFLGYQVVRIADAEVLEALAAGNVFARGIGLMRRVRQAVFERLATLAASENEDEHAEAASKTARL
jgi:hypothetical protein